MIKQQTKVYRPCLIGNEREAVDLTLILLNILTEAVAEAVIYWRREVACGIFHWFHPVNTFPLIPSHTKTLEIDSSQLSEDAWLIAEVQDQFKTPAEMAFSQRNETNQYCSPSTSEFSCKFQKWKSQGEHCPLYGVLKIMVITLMIVFGLGSYYGAQFLPKIFMRHWFGCQIVSRTGEALIRRSGGIMEEDVILRPLENWNRLICIVIRTKMLSLCINLRQTYSIWFWEVSESDPISRLSC